jgi:hypothetical protein
MAVYVVARIVLVLLSGKFPGNSIRVPGTGINTG